MTRASNDGDLLPILLCVGEHSPSIGAYVGKRTDERAQIH
jgi:hypothetical protein